MKNEQGYQTEVQEVEAGCTTDRERFVALGMELKKLSPTLFEAMLTQMRFHLGEVTLDAEQRAALVEQVRAALAPRSNAAEIAACFAKGFDLAEVV